MKKVFISTLVVYSCIFPLSTLAMNNEDVESFKCSDCEFTRHEQRIHPEGRLLLKCCYCEFTTFYEEHLTMHIRNYHLLDPDPKMVINHVPNPYHSYIADDSENSTIYNLNKLKRILEESGECVYCGFSTCDKKFLQRHMKEFHQSQQNPKMAISSLLNP